MPRRPPIRSRLATAAMWPTGIALTGWAYLWRITPMSRRELEGTWADDAPPPVPGSADRRELQTPQDGVGPMFRRRYRVCIEGADMGAAELMERLREDPNRVAPSGLAHFHKTGGDGPLAEADEYVVRMPGPWDGPVRVLRVTPTSFRFGTLDGHLEAGQIEWRAADEDGLLTFAVESWAAPSDRLSSLAHHRLRMAKEVQMHMWTTVCERVVRLSGGRRHGRLEVETHVVHHLG